MVVGPGSSTTAAIAASLSAVGGLLTGSWQLAWALLEAARESSEVCAELHRAQNHSCAPCPVADEGTTSRTVAEIALVAAVLGAVTGAIGHRRYTAVEETAPDECAPDDVAAPPSLHALDDTPPPAARFAKRKPLAHLAVDARNL